jgi:hypothetical protein
VSTYGLTESCGGVVYDGVPFEGTDVRIGKFKLFNSGEYSYKTFLKIVFSFGGISRIPQTNPIHLRGILPV